MESYLLIWKFNINLEKKEGFIDNNIDDEFLLRSSVCMLLK